jgi:transcriptional regulator GlxA family with amidase domain
MPVMQGRARSTPAVAVVALLPLLVACSQATASQEAPAPPPSEAPTDRPLQAAFLVVDGVYNSELMAPYDVLHHTVFHTDPDPGIEVFVVSPDGEAVTSFEGIRIVPHHSFESAPPIDILVVPSAEHSMGSDLENRAMIDWVRETAGSARWVMSLCDGAFVLAEAGLLDGRSATTFPSDYDAFAERFPDVHLRINVSFVHDGKMLTSQGGARSYDVAMYLVDLLYGEQVARGVGGGLLIPWPVERTTRGERDLFPPYTVVVDPQPAP